MSTVFSSRRTLALDVAAGLVASFLLRPSIGLAGALATGALAGACWAALYRRSTPALADALMAGAGFGIPAWIAVSVLASPVLHGALPRWSPEAMRSLLPALVRFVLFGAALGGLGHALRRAAVRLLGAEPHPAAPARPPPRRVVILGGGFAGATCAQELERLLGADRSVEVTLVSDTNALLFTPMLAEVAGSSLEPTHISTPLRSTLRRTTVLRGAVVRADLDAREVELAPTAPDGAPRTLRYDHLVLALGAVTNWFGNPSVQANAIGFKSLREAIQVRDRVIDAFERAAREDDPGRRRGLLTFVVAGGGFAGVELAGALNDFARGMVADFPGITPEDVRVLLVHAGDRILPELSASLGAYAQARLGERGVEIRLRARVKDARPGAVVLDPGELVPAETLVWTAGARPHPLVGALPLARDRRGALVVGPGLDVPGTAGVWAAGDCAAVTDGRTGKPCPPTAQFALREGRHLARNVIAALRGRKATAFHFDSLGALCVIGHQTACAELRVPFVRGRAVRFSGLLAWFLWRSIYLSKLPGLDRKVRVLADWTIELFFPRDTAQTGDGPPEAIAPPNATPARAER